MNLCDLCVFVFVIFVLERLFNTKASKGGHEGHKEETRNYIQKNTRYLDKNLLTNWYTVSPNRSFSLQFANFFRPGIVLFGNLLHQRTIGTLIAIRNATAREGRV